MKRFTTLAVAVLLASVATATTAVAQSKYIWVGGAMTQPIGDSKDVFESGFLADVGLGIPLGGQRLSLQIGGLYGSSDIKGVDASVDMMGGTVGLEYDLMTGGKITPYLYGNAGLMNMDNGITDAESKMMFAAGGGLGFSLTPKVSLWADVRYLSIATEGKATTFMPIAAGLSFRFGGN
jgi:opacity protein-like surface antigen